VLTTTYTNLVNPHTGVAPFRHSDRSRGAADVGNSTFHAFQLNARRAFQDGLLLLGELHVVSFDQ